MGSVKYSNTAPFINATTENKIATINRLIGTFDVTADGRAEVFYEDNFGDILIYAQNASDYASREWVLAGYLDLDPGTALTRLDEADLNLNGVIDPIITEEFTRFISLYNDFKALEDDFVVTTLNIQNVNGNLTILNDALVPLHAVNIDGTGREGKGNKDGDR